MIYLGKSLTEYLMHFNLTISFKNYFLNQNMLLMNSKDSGVISSVCNTSYLVQTGRNCSICYNDEHFRSFRLNKSESICANDVLELTYKLPEKDALNIFYRQEKGFTHYVNNNKT